MPQKNDVSQKTPEQPPAPVFFLSFFDAEQPAQNAAQMNTLVVGMIEEAAALPAQAEADDKE